VRIVSARSASKRPALPSRRERGEEGRDSE
jgi:hypothetical protein